MAEDRIQANLNSKSDRPARKQRNIRKQLQVFRIKTTFDFTPKYFGRNFPIQLLFQSHETKTVFTFEKYREKVFCVLISSNYVVKRFQIATFTRHVNMATNIGTVYEPL